MTERTKFALHIAGVHRDQFGWHALRDLFDAYVTALAAMPDGPAPDQVVLLGIGEGSAVPTFSAPRRTARAMAILARGPTRQWTHDQRRQVEPLYGVVRQTGVSLSAGQRRLRPVFIPDLATACRLREETELRARVQTVGYAVLHAQLDFDLHGVVRCDGPAEIIRALGQRLHGPVFVGGVARWDMDTGALLTRP